MTGSKRPRILIADDEGDTLMVLARRFNAHGFEVFTAADGDQALAVFRANHLDLVLLDLNMPRLDGLLVLREMLQAVATIPVIVMSGTATANQGQLLIDEGARLFIEKPIDFGKLEKAIDELVPRR